MTAGLAATLILAGLLLIVGVVLAILYHSARKKLVTATQRLCELENLLRAYQRKEVLSEYKTRIAGMKPDDKISEYERVFGPSGNGDSEG